MKLKDRSLKINQETEMELFGYQDFFQQQYWNNCEKAKFRMYSWIEESTPLCHGSFKLVNDSNL